MSLNRVGFEEKLSTNYSNVLRLSGEVMEVYALRIL